LSVAAIYGILLISALIAVPIRSVGLASYIIGVVWFFGTIAAIAAVVGIIVGIFKLGMKISKNLSRRTIPGHLMEAQRVGWKNKICPVITGKQK